MSTTPENVPNKPAPYDGIRPSKPNVLTGPDVLRQEYVTQSGYQWNTTVVLSPIVDVVEREVGPDTFERMTRDPKIHKSRRIRVNGALTDDLIFAPGKTEDEAGSESEYKRFTLVYEFAERMVAGLDKPYWSTAGQMLGGALEQGHKIAETNWEYQMDRPAKRSTTTEVKKRGAKPRSLLARIFAAKDDGPQKPEGSGRTGILSKTTVRMMPKSIRVKPRGSALFVVDQFGNEVGILPAWKAGNMQFNTDDIITREKFMVLTNDPEDDDPRGNSAWRPAFNWWNFKMHLPKEYLRYCLQEAMPIPVFEMPEGMERWMVKRDPVTQQPLMREDDPTQPQLEDSLDAARKLIEAMRNGKGVAIPPKSKLTAYVGKGSNGDGVFPKAIDVADRQIEDSILNQQLAQSEGEHQARAASITHEGRLNDVFFWDKRAIAVMTLYDFIAVGVKYNFGDWALAYMPKLSLGDSEKRDWARDLEVVSKAYFYGFIDDTQRAELMAWLSLPKPGPSRQELGLEDNQAQMDANGEPVVGNSNRPDKQPANKGRNNGNGTPKQSGQDELMAQSLDELHRKVRNAEITQSGVFALGHHTRRRRPVVEYLPGRR